MCYHQDRKIEFIEAVNWLKARYESKLNPDITSVLFCQSEEAVWIKITWRTETILGAKTKEEVINLDFIAEPYEVPLDIAPDEESRYEKCTFLPTEAIEKNAEEFFKDEITLLNTTPLFD